MNAKPVLFFLSILVSCAMKAQTVECPRATPEPVLREDACSQHRFSLENQGSAFEFGVLPNGTELVIIHAGCEHYTLVLQFYTEQFDDDTQSAAVWYENIVYLLNEVKESIEAPIDISSAMDTLKAFGSAHQVFAEPLYTQHGDIAEFVELTRVVRVSPTKILAEVTFNIGPL
jgi:hypothetical protein